MVAATLSGLGTPVLSCAGQPPNWATKAAARLKSIYENRDFRDDRFRATWNKDGLSYTLRRREKPEAQWVESIIDFRSGKAIDATELDSEVALPVDPS
ncbi:MAG: hypothetical protein FJ308_11010, partial [Planctomycetes bacterium]|nr:hypothetical protein [Planctomycetota bacterium]